MGRAVRGLVTIPWVLFLGAAVLAQATAQLGGIVRDESGAVLPGVTVTATQIDTGFTRTVVTSLTVRREFGANKRARAQSTALGDTHVFGPSAVNSFRVTWNRTSNRLNDPPDHAVWGEVRFLARDHGDRPHSHGDGPQSHSDTESSRRTSL